MKRVTLYISDPQYSGVQELAEQRGRPYSELIREALEQYLRREAQKPAPRRAQTRRKA